jgi:hypothetical protein
MVSPVAVTYDTGLASRPTGPRHISPNQRFEEDTIAHGRILSAELVTEWVQQE